MLDTRSNRPSHRCIETHLMADLLALLGIDLPIIQAPMAGVSTPAMAAAVANAGALGSLGVGSSTAQTARAMIAQVRARSTRSLNVNVFCHQPPIRAPMLEQAWIARLRPELERLGAAPPAQLSEIYTSFAEDDAMLAMLLEVRPKVVSLHFGLPSSDRIRALRDAGIVLLATATNLGDARTLAAAGVHAIIAQGYEAGGHRGTFDPDAADDELGTLALTRLDPSARSRAHRAGDCGGRDHGRRGNHRRVAARCERCPAGHRVHRLHRITS